ncbi:MAG: glycosyltransferase family 4 protein, partial [Candidatus Sumerlaeaceae bacterium]|nr:glycosyltransferase family 4 protein [Candidatus Sumerlaeaceae bacterium]
MPDNRPTRVLLMCAVDFTVRQFLLPLAAALKATGYDVTIACSRGPYFDEIRAAGFDIRENPISRSMNVLSHTGAILRTWKLLRREKFDVVHVHTPIAALVGRIAARLAGVRVKIYTAHGFYFHDEMSPGKRRFHVALERLGAACGDFLFTVSKEDEQAAQRLGIAQSGRVETIYNGVDLARFNPSNFDSAARDAIRQKLQIPAAAPVVGIVGRLVREKGFYELFDAMARIIPHIPEARLLIVGDVLPSDYDADKADMLAHIQRLGLTERTAFAGLVPDTAPYLAAMDVFALPSYREGMPVSLLEAMAMELPAVATNIRGCREEVVDGETGWLVPTRDAEQLGDRIQWLLQNREKARELGRSGRRRVEAQFDFVKVLQHQIDVYGRL